MIERVQGLLISKGSPSLKVQLSSFQLGYSTTIHSTGRILRILILTGTVLSLVSVIIMMARVFNFIGLKLKREPSGHNLLTCHLVLVLAAALG